MVLFGMVTGLGVRGYFLTDGTNRWSGCEVKVGLKMIRRMVNERLGIEEEEEEKIIEQNVQR